MTFIRVYKVPLQDCGWLQTPGASQAEKGNNRGRLFLECGKVEATPADVEGASLETPLKANAASFPITIRGVYMCVRGLVAVMQGPWVNKQLGIHAKVEAVALKEILHIFLHFFPGLRKTK